MATAPAARPSGSRTDSPPVAFAASRAVAAASSADSDPSAGVAADGSATGSVSPGRTSRPTPPVPAGVPNPQSSSRSACSVVDTG